MPLIDQQKQQQQDDLQLKLQSINDKYLKMIINQTIDNFVNILDINYPHSFDYMLKTILEFSSNKSTIKYSSSHLKVFISIVRKREQFADNNCLTKKDFD